MIGLDTNILLRYITQDDPSQSPVATKWMEERLSKEDPGFVSLVSLVEMSWVLQRRYRWQHSEIADAVRALVQIDRVLIQNEREVYLAAEAAASGLSSFPDALIAALGQGSGCTVTLTFDRRASRLPGMTLLSSTT